MKSFRIIKNNLFMLKYAFKYIPGLCIAVCIVQFLFGFFDIMWGVYVMKFVIDGVQFGYPVWQVLLFLFCYLLYGVTIQSAAAFVYEMYAPKSAQILSKAMQTMIFKKAIKIDYECYDDPQFYNDFIIASSYADGKIMEILMATGDLIKNITATLGLGILIIVLDNIGIVFVVVSLIVTAIINTKRNKINYKKDIDLIPLQRKRDYSKRVFYLADFAKEIRLSRIKTKLINDYSDSNKSIIKLIKRYSSKIFYLDFLKSFVFGDLLLNFAYLFSLAYKAVVLKSITYGSLTGLTGGIWTFKSKIEDLLGGFVKFHECSLYIDRYRTFMEYEPKIVSSKNAINEIYAAQIKLENVNYKYNSCDEPTLKNINMTINPGEKIAIVGYNGAGKTTLIKLILRLYDVSCGNIYYNNIDIKNYDVNTYRHNFGTVFQDYKLFAATIRDNVIMSTNTIDDDPNVISALEYSGFSEKLMTLPFRLNTNLTKEFDEEGVNLSGGESQKIAIARIFAKKCSTIILDEPSSALDPVSEYNLNESMMNAAKDKTVIFISHRLSTTVSADRIYMLENGEIIEAGSHKELMSMNGKYAEMFNIQAKNYKTGNGK